MSAPAKATFKITNRRAPRYAVTGLTRRAAGELAALASSLSPVETGKLAGSWHVEPGRAVGAYVVVNDTPWARYQEFGTREVAPVHMLGRARAQLAARYGAR
jgi:hypothetical protein